MYSRMHTSVVNKLVGSRFKTLSVATTREEPCCHYSERQHQVRAILGALRASFVDLASDAIRRLKVLVTDAHMLLNVDPSHGMLFHVDPSHGAARGEAGA